MGCNNVEWDVMFSEVRMKNFMKKIGNGVEVIVLKQCLCFLLLHSPRLRMSDKHW